MKFVVLFGGNLREAARVYLAALLLAPVAGFLAVEGWRLAAWLLEADDGHAFGLLIAAGLFVFMTVIDLISAPRRFRHGPISGPYALLEIGLLLSGAASVYGLLSGLGRFIHGLANIDLTAATCLSMTVLLLALQVLRWRNAHR